MWLEILFGALLSTKSTEDLQYLNPYFEADSVALTLDVVVAVILHANRIGHINRCVSTLRKVQKLLAKLEPATPKDDPRRIPADVRAGLDLEGETLAKTLRGRRTYMEGDGSAGYGYDPRFLVFEFTWNIMLWAPQVSKHQRWEASVSQCTVAHSPSTKIRIIHFIKFYHYPFILDLFVYTSMR